MPHVDQFDPGIPLPKNNKNKKTDPPATKKTLKQLDEVWVFQGKNPQI